MNAPAAPVVSSLAHLPLVLLAAPMGLGGVGLAWRQAATSLGAPPAIGEAVLALTAPLWLLVVALHVLRALRHPAAMLAELRHPVRAAFVAAPTIGLMLLSAAAFPYLPRFAAMLWVLASALHLLVAMLLLRRILGGGGDAAMLAPPLLLPFVGSIVAPVFGPRMGFIDASWMMFGVGCLLWLVVTPLLLHRLLAGPPLPPALKPSLVILLAPPALGAVAVAELSGTIGGLALAFAGVALLIAAVLLSLAADFARLPFTPGWWGTTFPTAAFAAMLMALGAHPALGWAALLVTTALTAWVAWRTLRAAQAGALTRPEG